MTAIPTTRCELRLPNLTRLFDHVRSNAGGTPVMVRPNSHVGQTVAICGAGPSLRDDFLNTLPATDHVWACNSALPYLMDQRVRVTHGFTIDQGEEMLGPQEWQRTFPVRYLCASCVTPALIAHLRQANRKIQFFHSYLGVPDPDDYVPREAGERYEMALYRNHYPPSVQVGHGLNSVPRAVCLALVMGFSRILVYGADCAARPDYAPLPQRIVPGAYAAWLRGLILYADGRSAADAYGDDVVMAEAVIDGRRWHTRPDMVISAMHLLDLARVYPGRITYIGDTLPNVLARQDADFLARMPTLNSGAVHNFGIMPTFSGAST